MSTAAEQGVSIGVDVGGTFTDVIGWDAATREFRIAKVPSTTGEQALGFLRGVERLGWPWPAIGALVHGTTVGTNAVLERRGAKVGLIATRGFRDVLELGRRTRPHLYGMAGGFVPLIPRALRVEVTERIDAEGNVLVPLDEAEVHAAIAALRAAGVESVVIHFIHAYANPAHERRTAEILRQSWPNDFISLGSEILPEVREFERGTAAALNGYLQPVMARYLVTLDREIHQRGFRRELLITQANGGTMAASIAASHAIQTILSGPAAGAIATARIAVEAGLPNVIGCDMGGTSFDVAVISAGKPDLSAERDIDYGIPVRIPTIDIHTIGAGGGSIARVNRAGILQVGPESAGAVPGPVCFGRGGAEPTVTDAQLLLGRLDPGSLLGVNGEADVDAVRAVIQRRVGDPLGLDAEDAAAAILAVVNNSMAGAIRLVSVERGHDPREFAIFAFGGAGPLHAVALARELGIPRVLVPVYPGIVSALGCIVADIRHDYLLHLNRPLGGIDAAEIDHLLAGQAAAGRALIAREAVATDRIEITHDADMKFAGQTHEFRVPLSSPGFDPALLRADFQRLYHRRFGIEMPEIEPVIGNLRTTVFGRRPQPDLGRLLAAPQATNGTVSRRVRFGATWHEAPVHQRAGLRTGETIPGPAIIAQLDTTLVLEPGSAAEVDRAGNLIVTVGDA